MLRDFVIVALLWIVFTAVGIALVLEFIPFPVAADDEATIVDDAFTLPAALPVPVFAFVVAALIYSTLRFRSKGQPSEDGPSIRSHGPAVAAWLVSTTALTVAVIIHPGVTGLNTGFLDYPNLALRSR